MADVVVTGAAGFIGSAVVRLLLEQGRSVRCILEPGGDASNLEGLDVERVVCDVCEFEAMRKALDGSPTLYHLAAIYKTWLDDETTIWRVNVEGTTATLLAARAAGVKRVVYTSSIAAIGWKEGGLASEATTFNLFDIANPYIQSKWLSERVALNFAAAGMDVVVVNPAFPFGPGDVAPTPTGNIVRGVLSRQVRGWGSGGFCAIDVEDCARGHLLAEERGVRGERYILGNHNVTYRDFFALVAQVAGVPAPTLPIPNAVTAGVAYAAEKWADHISRKEPIGTYKSVKYAQREIFFSNEKARRDLGLPTRPLEETVARAVAWFRDGFEARARS
ncbi:MAG: SDR family oxidoreductase [Myxococcales bacterium]|nr:SDR family oxidoreductase [Myxococcales bacterium]